MIFHPRQRRWRPRFSLRTFLLITMLIACGLGWRVSQIRNGMRQQAAVHQLRQMGGHATFAYQLDAQRKNMGPPLSPSYLRRFTGDAVLSDVVRVTWHAPLAGGDDLEILSNLSRVQDLRLNMRRLSDDSLAPVTSLTNLRRLDLWCTQITDRGLAHLAGLRHLRQLDLHSTQVTDEGLANLHGLKRLRQLKLRNTNVTADGAARLQRKLPNCKILGVPGYPDGGQQLDIEYRDREQDSP